VWSVRLFQARNVRRPLTIAPAIRVRGRAAGAWVTKMDTCATAVLDSPDLTAALLILTHVAMNVAQATVASATGTEQTATAARVNLAGQVSFRR
jgi:hypothetical protein